MSNFVKDERGLRYTDDYTGVRYFATDADGYLKYFDDGTPMPAELYEWSFICARRCSRQVLGCSRTKKPLAAYKPPDWERIGDPDDMFGYICPDCIRGGVRGLLG